MSDPRDVLELVTREKTYRVIYNNRALRIIEKETGQPLGEQEHSITSLTIMVYAGLLQHTPGATMETADAIVDELGYEDVMGIVLPAVKNAAPFAKKTGKPQLTIVDSPDSDPTNSGE